MSARSLPGDRAGTQAPRHAAVLRDRSGLRRRSRQELLQGSSGAEPRAGQAGNHRGRPQGDGRGRLLRAVPRAPMMSRLLVFVVALAGSMPAFAQTRMATLTAAGEVGAVSLSPSGDRIAAGVGKDRVSVWSLPTGKLLQDVKVSQPPISILFGPADQIVVALADGAIEVRSLASGALVRRMDASARQPQ